MTLTTEIHGVEVDVDYTYCKPWRAPRDKYGQATEPDEPEAIIIDKVLTRHGDDITDLLSARVLQELQDKCEEDYADRE